jgi:hypothetical protein
LPEPDPLPPEFVPPEAEPPVPGFVPPLLEFVPPPLSPPDGTVAPLVLPAEAGASVVGGFVAIEFEVFAFSLFMVFAFPLVFARVLPLLAMLAAVGVHSNMPNTVKITEVNKNILIIILSPYSVLFIRSGFFVRWNTSRSFGVFLGFLDLAAKPEESIAGPHEAVYQCLADALVVDHFAMNSRDSSPVAFAEKFKKFMGVLFD